MIRAAASPGPSREVASRVEAANELARRLAATAVLAAAAVAPEAHRVSSSSREQRHQQQVSQPVGYSEARHSGARLGSPAE